MSNLKTLKDIDAVDHMMGRYENETVWVKVVHYEQLRQTARGWIEWLNDKDSWKYVPDEDKASHNRIGKGLAPFLYNKYIVEYFIKHFFNLEDDV